MAIIHSRHEITLAAPDSEAPEAWLVAVSDASWRSLTDFRNWPDWMPQVRSAKQEDSAPPARGTRLKVDLGHSIAACSIDYWNPPKSMQLSMRLAGGEIAYGFLIETSSQPAQLHIVLELEQSLSGIAGSAAFFFKWRLSRLGSQIIANLASQARSPKSL